MVSGAINDMTATCTDTRKVGTFDFSFKVINEASKPYIPRTLLCLLGSSNINVSPTNLGRLCSMDKGRYTTGSTHSIGPL